MRSTLRPSRLRFQFLEVGGKPVVEPRQAFNARVVKSGPMEEPDFEALAASWVEGDPRTQELEPERRERLLKRLAEAMKNRRQDQMKDQRGDLVVKIDPDRLGGKFGLDESALDELVGFIQEVADKDTPDD